MSVFTSFRNGKEGQHDNVFERGQDKEFGHLKNHVLRNGNGREVMAYEKHRHRNKFFEKRKSSVKALPKIAWLTHEGRIDWVVSRFTCSLFPDIQKAVAGLKRPAQTINPNFLNEQEEGLAQYRAWCDEHDINHPPITDVNLLKTVAVFSTFTGLEALIGGAALLGTGNFQSPFDSMVFAGGIALINIGLSGGAFGYLIMRYWKHSKLGIQLWCKALALPTLLMIGGIHSGMFFMRLTENVQDLRNFSLWSSDIGVMDIAASLLLLLIGLLASGVAIYHGYNHCGDKNPEHLDVYHRCVGQFEKEEDSPLHQNRNGQSLELLLKEAEGLLFDARAKLDEERTALDEAKKKWQETEEELQTFARHLEDSYAEKYAELEQVFNTLGKVFTLPEDQLDLTAAVTSIPWDDAIEQRALDVQKRARETFHQLELNLQTVRNSGSNEHAA